MPSGPLAHISFLVKDLDKSIEDWTKILSVLDPKQLDRQIVRYDDFDGGGDKMRWATFVSDHGAEIQLMEPDPDSAMGRRLAKHGEHVHHICLTTPDVEGSLETLQNKGVEIVGRISSDPSLGWQKWGWISAKSAHGVLIEVAKPYETHDDGNWHPVLE